MLRLKLLYEYLAIFSLCVRSISVCSLRCYNCSSIVDEKCGKEWKFVGSEAEKYEVECPKNATHCVKHITFPLSKFLISQKSLSYELPATHLLITRGSLHLFLPKRK